MALPTGSETPSASATAAPVEGDPKKGLSAGAIAGIVVGSIVGLALLIGRSEERRVGKECPV